MAKKLNTTTEIIEQPAPIVPALLSLRERLDAWQTARQSAAADIQESVDRRILAIIEARTHAMLDIIGG